MRIGEYHYREINIKHNFCQGLGLWVVGQVIIASHPHGEKRKINTRWGEQMCFLKDDGDEELCPHISSRDY